MSKVEELEAEIRSLSTEDLAQLRDWFMEFDWRTWDQQLEEDARAGRLDDFADEVLREDASGRTRSL